MKSLINAFHSLQIIPYTISFFHSIYFSPFINNTITHHRRHAPPSPTATHHHHRRRHLLSPPPSPLPPTITAATHVRNLRSPPPPTSANAIAATHLRHHRCLHPPSPPGMSVVPVPSRKYRYRNSSKLGTGTEIFGTVRYRYRYETGTI
ncbi:hypothetical protein HanPSC8_Chr14g0614851 [Helianthus annuus]|nr:hypothetical protein HanPSC8_Chr14g0614851 [Helianthus annuus]